MNELLNTVEGELTKLKKWFDINKLSLNVSKTKFIVFGNRKVHDEVTLKIDDVEIERVAENKFLGVIIDKKLNWKTHIKYIKSKISKSIAILHKTKHILDQRSLHMLYSSLITPYLTYCAELWGNTYKTNTNCIVLLQKRAIRIVNGVDYIHPTNLLFANSRSLKFKDLVELKTLEILFRAKSKTLPDCIQGLFSMRESRYLLRGKLIFKQNKERINVRSRCVSVKGVKMWNKCENELKECSNMSTFKNIFKKKVLESYKK